MTGNVQYMDDQSVKLAPKFGFFRRQAEIDTLNANTDFDRVSRLMKGTPKQVFVYNGDPTQLNASLNDENLKTYGVWPKEEKDQPDADTEITSKRNRALSSYSDNVENALSVYNDILSLTRNPETIGDRIIKAHEQGKQLDLFNELHPSVNENGKAATRDSLEILDQRLSNLGLTRASFNILPTNIEQGLSINLGEGQIGDLNLSQVDIQRISVQVLRNPALLNEGISRYLPRIMFLMMPLAAFIGIGFIRGRRNALLYDHLVHAAYIHAVTFGFLVVLILLAQWTPIPASFNIFLIGMMIYLPLSAKRMFQRGWFKTIIASYGIATIYALVMLIVVTILTATSVKQAVEMGQL